MAQFVANVAEFVGDKDVDSVLRDLEGRLQQYRVVEMKLLTQLKDLQGKLPEIKKSLDVVTKLQEHQSSGSEEDMTTDFEISEGIFTQASIKAAKSVCLWLGANVMLEYSLAEASELLGSNLGTATGSITALEGDIDFLRDQINTTEVTIARIHNWDVKQRRSKQQPS